MARSDSVWQQQRGSITASKQHRQTCQRWHSKGGLGTKRLQRSRGSPGHTQRRVAHCLARRREIRYLIDVRVSAVKIKKTGNGWVQRLGGLGWALTQDIGRRPGLLMSPWESGSQAATLASTVYVDGRGTRHIDSSPSPVVTDRTMCRGGGGLGRNPQPQASQRHIAWERETRYGVPLNDAQCRLINTLYEGDKGCR